MAGILLYSALESKEGHDEHNDAGGEGPLGSARLDDCHRVAREIPCGACLLRVGDQPAYAAPGLLGFGGENAAGAASDTGVRSGPDRRDLRLWYGLGGAGVPKGAGSRCRRNRRPANVGRALCVAGAGSIETITAAANRFLGRAYRSPQRAVLRLSEQRQSRLLPSLYRDGRGSRTSASAGPMCGSR